MGLEVAVTVNQLDPTNPLGTDARSQGDDHVRLIKSTLKNTFPNFTGPLLPTQDELAKITLPGVLCFPGMIVMWSGTLATIPTGWKLCDGTGTISNGNVVPNLRERFIIASVTEAGGTYNINSTGGTKDIATAGSVGNTMLTVDQIPPHVHSTGMSFLNPGGNGGAPGGLGIVASTGSTGGGAPHTHTFTGTTQVGANIPPYFALAFLIKN